jgi:hypothetical protein
MQSSLRGALAGAVATVVMTLEQPLDKRPFDSRYDDVEIPGTLAASRRAFGQATIRDAVFGIVLGLLEDALNNRSARGVG